MNFVFHQLQEMILKNTIRSSIRKEYMVNNLLSETLSESQRRIMDDLFVKLSSVENDQETGQMLMEYTDYRNYLDYDIKIKYASGDFAYFSKVNKEKIWWGKHKHHSMLLWQQVLNKLFAIEIKMRIWLCCLFLTEAFNIWITKNTRND